MFSNIKSENSLGNLCGYVTIRFCIFASFNDMLLFLPYIKHLISKLCREEMKEEKSEMSCPVSSAREHEPIMFPQAQVRGGGSASSGGSSRPCWSTALPCTLCMNGVECWHVKGCLMEPSVYNKPGPAALLGRWCKLTEVKATVRQDYSRDIKSGF